MQRLLFTPAIFIDAFIHQDKKALLALEHTYNTPYLQGWVLSNAVEQLLNAKVPKSNIITELKNFATIPINAKLVNLALTSEKEYSLALYEAAIEKFNIDSVVDCQASFMLSIGYSQVLEIKEKEETDFIDIKANIHPIFEEVDGHYMEIIQKTNFSGGNHSIKFEQEFADYCGTKYASGVSSGTSALKLALESLGITRGDEVITVPNTFIATTEIISQLGAKVVFVDIDPISYNLNPNQLESKITEKTRAIVPVHLYGQPVEMEPILKIACKYNLKILEDASQAHGAYYKNKRVGNLGDVAAFSLYPTKNLGAFGEAGIITTNSKAIINKVNLLKNHGQDKRYSYSIEGYNSRMDNLQGAVLRSKLVFLDEWNENRRSIADCYNNILKNCNKVQIPFISKNCQSVFYVYPLLVEDVKSLHKYLLEKQIKTNISYSSPLHLEKAYSKLKLGINSYPVAESYYKKLICLPIYPFLTIGKATKIAQTILQFFVEHTTKKL